MPPEDEPISEHYECEREIKELAAKVEELRNACKIKDRQIDAGWRANRRHQKAKRAWARNKRALQDEITKLKASAPLFPLNEYTIEILGRPNFACCTVADLLRFHGIDIPRKAEEEQAAVIYWTLTHYMQHGENWRVAAQAELMKIAEERAAKQPA